jgi:hypothetical protein
MDNVIINEEDRLLVINKGAQGTYSLDEIEECTIQFEDAHFKGKSKPFSHVIYDAWVQTGWLRPPACYIGLIIKLKNKETVYAYISNHKVRYGTKEYDEDKRIAKKIKKKIDMN